MRRFRKVRSDWQPRAACLTLEAGGHNDGRSDILSTKRDYRAEARPVFEDMGRLLGRIRDDEDMRAGKSGLTVVIRRAVC
jgi:hypothetical protein